MGVKYLFRFLTEHGLKPHRITIYDPAKPDEKPFNGMTLVADAEQIAHLLSDKKDSGCKWLRMDTPSVYERVRRFIQAFRAAGVEVVFVGNGTSEKYKHYYCYYLLLFHLSRYY